MFGFIKDLGLGMAPKIKKDKVIRKKFEPGMKRTYETVDWFVVHGTAGGGTLNWWRNTPLNSKRGRLYTRGIALTHYLIERDGTIWEIVDPKKYWLHHASIGKLDKGTVGVELLNPTRDNSGPYTEEQYQALADLYEHLYSPKTFRKAIFPEMSVILGHCRAKQKISGGWKNCPGDGFDWDKFGEVLKTRGYTYENKAGIASMWNLRKKGESN